MNRFKLSRSARVFLEPTTSAEEGSSLFSSLPAPEEADSPDESDSGDADRLAAVLAYFQDDIREMVVLDGWREGMKKSDILKLGLITQDEYKAAVKKIHRYAQSLPKTGKKDA